MRLMTVASNSKS